MSISEIARDEANQRRAERQVGNKRWDLTPPFDPILDGVDLDVIFGLDHELVNHRKHNRLRSLVDVDEF
jgi:hypothetical protein